MKAIFEVERDGNSVTIWEAGIGHRVIFSSELEAEKQEIILQADERKFQEAKRDMGVAVIDKFGETLTPYTYVQRTFKAYKSKIGIALGITVYEDILSRTSKEFW